MNIDEILKHETMEFGISLRSDAYGEETLRYENTEQAVAGLRRLLTLCVEASKRDHIDRELEVILLGARFQVRDGEVFAQDDEET